MPFLTSTYRLFRRFFAPSARGLHQLKDKIGVYIQLKALLWRYELLKGGYNIASALLLLLCLGVCVGFALFFFGIGLAMYWNHCLESVYMGYLGVGGVYIVMGVAGFFFLRSAFLKRWFLRKANVLLGKEKIVKILQKLKEMLHNGDPTA